MARRMSLRLLAIAATVAMFAGCAGGNDGPGAAEPAGSRSAQPASLPQRPYLDQPVPGLTPERFAPGIVSTDAIELNGVFSADGQELYFLASYDRAGTGPAANYDLWFSRRVNGAWAIAELLGPPISTAAMCRSAAPMAAGAT
jgi:hypothetical protein